LFDIKQQLVHIALNKKKILQVIYIKTMLGSS